MGRTGDIATRMFPHVLGLTLFSSVDTTPLPEGISPVAWDRMVGVAFCFVFVIFGTMSLLFGLRARRAGFFISSNVLTYI